MGLEKSNTRFKGYKNNNKILKNNNKYNKRSINENNEELFIIRKNNNTSLNLNSNIMINNRSKIEKRLNNANKMQNKLLSFSISFKNINSKTFEEKITPNCVHTYSNSIDNKKTSNK